MIRCLIVDDKPLAIDVLKHHLAKVPFLELAHSTTDPLDALNQVMKGGIDLIFLDIQMPELSGLQLTKIIRTKCQVIFTTAYSEYALEGFENNAIDYLLKPVSFERFYKAAEKAQFVLQALAAGNQTQALSPTSDKETDHIFVKTEYKLVRVNTADIVYVEGMQNYIVICTPTEKITSLQTMKKTEGQLPSSQFLRVHKSFIVALNKISSIERNRIYIADQVIALGDVYKDAFYKAIS